MYKNIINQTIVAKSIAIVCTVSLLTACFHEKNEDANVTSSNHYAVVTTNIAGVDGNTGSGDVSIISLEDYSIDNTNFGTGTDTTVSTNNEHYYHLGRTPEGNVTKFHINNPENYLSQHKAQETNDVSSNPHKLIVKDENTAFLIRYEKSEIWIVNPSAANNETYKTGSIDLSNYAGDDGTPEATDAILIDNKLYVLMQNLDRNNGWIPGIGYLAIFDTDNDNEEIDTNSDDSTPHGIALSVTNPNEMDYLETNNTLYIAGVGPYSVDYTGGIEAIDTTDYSSNIIIDRTDTSIQSFGQTKHVAILNSTRGYFVGYVAWQDTGVYSFNPTTGEIDDNPLLVNKDISDIEIGPLGDLWVANRSDFGITIFSTVDNTVTQELISTGTVKPSDIEFISVEQSN